MQFLATRAVSKTEKRIHLSLFSFITLLFMLISPQVMAQDSPVDIAAKMGSNVPFATLSTTGPRTSPFEPLDKNKSEDVQFIVDDASGLDTGCTFRNGGPLNFSVPVTRFVGSVNSDGTLQDPSGLVGAGVLSSTAKLTMPAFDVDSRANVPNFNPERDRILFNGEEIGFLDGLNNEWILNSFEVSIDKVKFPDQAPAGSDPSPAMNTISIQIDVENSQQVWCTAIDWAKLEIKAMSPVIMIHGNGSDAGFYDRQGFVEPLRNAKFPIDGCDTCKNPINLASGTEGSSSISANGNELFGLIPEIVKTFGTNSYHLVVHSKGGLDSRKFLEMKGSDKNFQLISYTSLSTPHNGSVLADFIQKYSIASRYGAETEFSGFPLFTQKVAEQVEIDDGIPNLTTYHVAGFNSSNLNKLPRGPIYNTVAADADLNGNEEIDRFPDEFAQLRAESEELSELSSISALFAINVPYKILRNTRSIGVTLETKKAFFGLGGYRTVATFTRAPTAQDLGNDVLVTIPSGIGENTFAAFASNSAVFEGSNGRNHSDVANSGVALTVIPWILNSERVKGDLK